MPRLAARPDMSPKGSIATDTSAPSSENADCPYHSTRIALLSGCDWREGSRAVDGRALAPIPLCRVVGTRRRGDLLDVLVLAAAQQRGAGGDEAGDDREQEGLVQARAKRRGDQLREEREPGERPAAGGRQRGEHMRPDEVFDRVVAEEGGEQHGHGRGVRGAGGRGGGLGGGTPPRRQRVREGGGTAEDQPRAE